MDHLDKNLEEILGSHPIQKRSAIKLHKRWEQETHKYHFGQNVYTAKTPEAADILLKRDFESIYEFKDDSEHLGLTMIPIGFIPAKPNILNLDKDLMNISLEARIL